MRQKKTKLVSSGEKKSVQVPIERFSGAPRNFVHVSQPQKSRVVTEVDRSVPRTESVLSQFQTSSGENLSRGTSLSSAAWRKYICAIGGEYNNKHSFLHFSEKHPPPPTHFADTVYGFSVTAEIFLRHRLWVCGRMLIFRSDKKVSPCFRPRL